MNVLHKKIHEHIVDIYDEILLKDKQARKKNADALDVEDYDLSKKMQSEAYAEIQILKRIRKALKEFEEKVNIGQDLSSEEENDEKHDITVEIFENYKVQKIDYLEDETYIEENHVNDEQIDVEPENVSVKLLGSTYELESIDEVLPKVALALMMRKPYAVSKLPWNNCFSIGGKPIFSYDPSKLISQGTKLSNGLWVARLNDKDEILAVSNKLLESLGYEENLIFL